MATEFSLTGQVRLDPRWVDDLNTTVVTDSVRVLDALTLVNGSAAPGQANAYWKDVVTIPGEESVTLDLTDLPLNVFGGAGSLNLAFVRVLLVRSLRPPALGGTDAVDVSLGTSVTATVGPRGLLLATDAIGSGWAEPELVLTNPTVVASDVEVYLVGVQAT